MEFKVFDLGLVEFEKSWQFQKEIFASVKAGDLNSALITCRHYPVITAGRLSKKENIKASQEELSKMSIPVYRIERGGDVTYHGPGQVITYPIFNLGYLKKDIRFFLSLLEDAVIKLLKELGIGANRRPNLTGVWIGRDKIASIGIAIKNWITYHGLSLNVKEKDLDNFGLIRPCGMDVKMTSLETLLDKDIDINEVKESFIEKIKEVI